MFIFSAARNGLIDYNTRINRISAGMMPVDWELIFL
jgi:outer membrane phospholipase A